MLTINSKLKPQNSSDLFDTSYLTADLKGRSVRGGAITVVSQACKFILQTGSTIVLARLLTPADFGLIAMVTAITNFALMFRDLGLSTATIQKADINHDQISTLFWVNAALGVSVAAVVFALAPAVAWFYDEPRLTPVTMALATTFIFGGLTVQHQAMLQRHMRFFAIGVIGIISMSVAVAVAIIAGLLGAGYWSLVLMHITLAVATAIGKWIAFPWKPGLPRRGVGLRAMLRFGGNITGYNIVNYFSRNADNILIGKFVGPLALGLYSKAYSLLMLPLGQINAPITAVATPALSRLQNENERYRNYYLRSLSLITFLTMPLVVYLIVMSGDIIRLLLGHQWIEAGPIFAFLGISGLVQPIGNTTGWLFITQNRTKEMFRWGLIGSTLTVASIIAGLPWGALGVAACYGISGLLIRTPLLLWFLGRKGPVRMIDFYKTVLTPSLIASCVLLILIFFRLYIRIENQVLYLLLSVLIAGVMAAIATWILPRGRLLFKQMFNLRHELYPSKSKNQVQMFYE